MNDLYAEHVMNKTTQIDQRTSGKFIEKNGERFYQIKNVDQMKPFFISVVSDSDHWLFVSSFGGLTAGRVSPETALFPYKTVDNIHDDNLHTGCKTIIKVYSEEQDTQYWEPYNREQDYKYSVTRNLYKNVLGDKLCFEEINHDLKLRFQYTWLTTDEYGFVRDCEVENLTNQNRHIEMIDGFVNLLPAGTPRFTQTNSSNLVDAYKWSELDESSGLGMFTLYSGITDRAEPCESLKANTVFCLGLDRTNSKILLSGEQLDLFKRGEEVSEESLKKGIRSAYLLNQTFVMNGQETKTWQLVANLEQSQGQVVELKEQLSTMSGETFIKRIMDSVEAGSDNLARMMAQADGIQVTDQETVSAHHYANVLFNVLRGGIFDDQYQILSEDLAHTIEMFNKRVFEKHRTLLASLPERIELGQLKEKVSETQDLQLARLVQEYLPITFGRRHGDPSRPWNQFAINLTDDHGKKLLSYQGNWRDIFQNWEALSVSYPEFVESMVAKFVNASTVDGYNPYRITKEGIDWEVEDPADPWSYIGYWGDHQIIYLQKLLELSNSFHPEALNSLLRKSIFSYANVPYRIKSFVAIKHNAKDTVVYDEDLADRIEQRVSRVGADGKMLFDNEGKVYQVNLMEKLMVTMLSKLGNMVIGGGIWLNTQRPEWNDANNALVGQGLSMVTLNYMRRYVSFLLQLFAGEQDEVELSTEVEQWLMATLEVFEEAEALISQGEVSLDNRYELLNKLGELSCTYRQSVYQQEGFSGKSTLAMGPIRELLESSLKAIDYTIELNVREDGLYHAYNLLEIDDQALSVDTLYPMLEGQVAALSSGYLSAKQANKVLKSLFASDVYREDQHTFMLYPDRELESYLNKNKISLEQVNNVGLLKQLVQDRNKQIIETDVQGVIRFNSQFQNISDLDSALENLAEHYQEKIEQDKEAIRALYEQTFNHKAFTGRSGGMFGFEGLGCIYWHMVSKLLLAVQEAVFAAVDKGEDAQEIRELSQWYYKVRHGIGFNKTPQEYGAFPTDPYSHTPKHAGAQQPGMTGQVKEEVLTRFGELGLRIRGGQAQFDPVLLRTEEFTRQTERFRYLDVAQKWQEIILSKGSLAYSWCQVPVVYVLDEQSESRITIELTDGKVVNNAQLFIDQDIANEIFQRSGKVKQITLVLNKSQLQDAL